MSRRLKDINVKELADLIRRYSRESIDPVEQRGADRFKALERRLERLERKLDDMEARHGN